MASASITTAAPSTAIRLVGPGAEALDEPAEGSEASALTPK